MESYIKTCFLDFCSSFALFFCHWMSFLAATWVFLGWLAGQSACPRFAVSQPGHLTASVASVIAACVSAAQLKIPFVSSYANFIESSIQKSKIPASILVLALCSIPTRAESLKPRLPLPRAGLLQPCNPPSRCVFQEILIEGCKTK